MNKSHGAISLELKLLLSACEAEAVAIRETGVVRDVQVIS